MIKEKRFFAGGNTAYGFYSLFHYITDPDSGQQLLIIKGGPGTGKSTLMRQVGVRMMEEGFATEVFRCSSDQNSVDGLFVPALRFAMVDGTAPHVIDPGVPGAYDEIVNLGTCWDTGRLKPQKKAIAALIRQNGDFFVQAYQYLKEAYTVMEKSRYLMSQAMDYQGVTLMTNRLLEEITARLPRPQNNAGERHLFAGAITPGGLLNFYPSILSGIPTVYLLTGDAGSGKSYLLRQVYQTIKKLGHHTEVYRCAFDPERFDAVVIPVLGTAFVKAAYPHNFTIPAGTEQHTLSLSRHSRPAVLKASGRERSESQERFWQLLGKAVELIGKAKQNHDQLEEYYIRAMDYDRVAAMREEIIQNALELAEKTRAV
jgi:hypothetical protein